MSTSSLEQAIQDKTAKVGVIGLGYVGLPLIRAFIAAGFRTMGFDVDQAKVDQLLAGRSYIKHIPGRVDRPATWPTAASCPRPTCGGWASPTPC